MGRFNVCFGTKQTLTAARNVRFTPKDASSQYPASRTDVTDHPVGGNAERSAHQLQEQGCVCRLKLAFDRFDATSAPFRIRSAYDAARRSYPERLIRVICPVQEPIKYELEINKNTAPFWPRCRPPARYRRRGDRVRRSNVCFWHKADIGTAAEWGTLEKADIAVPNCFVPKADIELLIIGGNEQSGRHTTAAPLLIRI